MTSRLVTAMLLSGTISSVLFGRLGDQFGKRRMILIALSTMLRGSIIGSLTDSVSLLIPRPRVAGRGDGDDPAGHQRAA